MTVTPIDPIARALVRHWQSGLRHPELKEAVCEDFPGLTLDRFNAAADLAWATMAEDDCNT